MFEDSQQIDQAILSFHELVTYKQKIARGIKPTFIGVGAGRCGTTTLYQILRKHRDVWMSPVKEVNHFGIRDKETNPDGMTFSEYLNYFLGGGESQHVGEFSPAYLNTPAAIENIHKYLPDTKIVLTVRQPLDRFVSQFKHHASMHGYSDLNKYVLAALESHRRGGQSRDWFSPARNLAQSVYAVAAERVLKYFPREAVHVVVFEDLRRDFYQTVRDLFDFLELPDDGSLEPGVTNQSKSDNLTLDLADSLRDQLLEIFDPDLARLSRVLGVDLFAQHLD